MVKTREISREKVAGCLGCPLGDEGGLWKVTLQEVYTQKEVDSMLPMGAMHSSVGRPYEKYQCGIQTSESKDCSLAYVANMADRALTKSSEAVYGPRLDGGD